MKQFTIKDVLDKILNFNLYSLKKYFRPAKFLVLFSIASFSLFYLGMYFKNEYELKKISEQEIESLISAKKYYKRSSICFNKIKDERLAREELEFYKSYESCMKARELTDHEIKVLEANWKDPFVRVMSFLDSPYYMLGPEPQYCRYNGNSMIDCNNGSSYILTIW